MIFQDRATRASQLPQVDENRRLEEASLLALQNILSSAEWIFRDERKDDVGVDGALEVRENGVSTNFRAQLQLKATNSPSTNQDGSISLPVAVSNLNYLLNGQSPLYVLFNASGPELRYVWARDEARRLQDSNPSWRDQQTVTLRFSAVLSIDSLAGIRERIRQESLFNSQSLETIQRASGSEAVRIIVDPNTLELTDPQANLEYLLEQGLAWVNAGNPQRVLEVAESLNMDVTRNPRVRLVKGYAHYVQSRFLDGVAELSRASERISELGQDDQEFLRYLFVVCRYHLGQTNLDELLAEQNTLQFQYAGACNVALWLLQMRGTLNSCTESESRRTCVDRIRTESAAILEKGDLAPALQCQVTTFNLYAEGAQMALEDSDRWFATKSLLRVGLRADLQETRRIRVERWSRWNEAINTVFNVAKGLQNPLLLADLHLNRAFVNHMPLVNDQVLANQFEEELPNVPEAVLASILADIQEAIEYFQRSGQLEGELMSKLLSAEVLILQGNDDEAVLRARDVLLTGQFMQFRNAVDRARRIIEHRSYLGSVRNFRTEMESRDKDEFYSEQTDEMLLAFASYQMKITGLPESRRRYVEAAALAMRLVAQERLNWCRHIELIEDLTHTKNPQTMYLVTPEQFGVCDELGHKAAIGVADYETALNSFKSTWCEGCQYRSPKRPSG